MAPSHNWRTAARGGTHLPHRSVITPLAVEPDAEARIGFHNQGAGGNVHSGCLYHSWSFFLRITQYPKLGGAR